MKATVVICFLIVISAIKTQGKCIKGNEDICERVRCASATTCSEGEILIPRNPEECICCSYCEPVNKTIEIEEKCRKGDEDICQRVDCPSVESCPEGEIQIPRDPKKCICCSYCKPNDKATEIKGKCRKGDENICHRVKCASVESCPEGEILIPTDPKKCICCSYCKPKDKEVPSTCTKDRTPEICSRTLCFLVKSCPPGQRLVKADLKKCICCNYCVDSNYN